MISSEAFVLALGLLLGCLTAWAFKRLPDERSGCLSRFRRVFFPSSRARHPAGFALGIEAAWHPVMVISPQLAAM